MALEVIYMDFPSVVIGSTVSFVVLIISYVVYKFGIAEKSFEQAIEDQKKRSIEEEQKQKSEKVKKEKKFKKTWGKKTKEKVESDNVPELVQIDETTDTATDIEIIAPKEVKPMKQKNKSKSGQQMTELSVQEKNKKAENLPVIEKATQDKKKTAPEVEKVKTEPKAEKTKVEPKAEKTKVELKAEKTKLEPKAEKTKLEPKAEKTKLEPKAERVKSELKVEDSELKVEKKETVVQSLSASSVQVSSPPAHKKKKKEHAAEKDATPMTTNKLLSMIKESELEPEEIQNVIDILLNKQKDSSGWTKKNDTLALTKKNLLEKEQQLDQEQRQTQAVTSKLKDLREEYNSLKAKLSSQEKQSHEKIDRLQQEIQMMTAKTKQIQEQLTAEKEKAVQIAKNEKTLEEERSKLLQKISKLETEFSGISKSEYDAIIKTRDELKITHALLVNENTQLASKEKLHSSQLSDAKAQIEKLNSSNKVLKESVESLESTRKSMEEKVKAEEKRCADLEIQMKELKSDVEKMVKLNAALEELRLENKRLECQVNEKLLPTKERYDGDGEEVCQQNGDRMSEEFPAETNGTEQLVQEKEKEIFQLSEEIVNLKSRISFFENDIAVQRESNDELRKKNWKAMEALEKAEKDAEQRIKEIQATTDQKIKELEKDLSVARELSNSNNDSSELSKRLKEVENDAAEKLADYTKEVEKNKRLSCEIDKLNELHNVLQKNVEELKSNLIKCEIETKECLQRICPSVTIDSSLPFSKWLLTFEQQAAVAVNSTGNTEELFEQREKEYLERLRHCEQLLSETESTLSQLQKKADLQGTLWQERLKNKEEELYQAKTERDALVAEKETMESTFQQIEELEEKLKLLQSTLENAESDRSHYEQKFDEVHKNCLNLRDQLENKEKQILELQKEHNSLDNLNKEIEDLKSKLDKEKKINKDFSSQMVRLNSLVKIGQDALTAEQEAVKKLKAQVEALQVSTANGTASATKTSPVKVNESQPKIKRTEKSKKRMDASDKK